MFLRITLLFAGAVLLLPGCAATDIGCVSDSECRFGRLCIDNRCTGFVGDAAQEEPTRPDADVPPISVDVGTCRDPEGCDLPDTVCDPASDPDCEECRPPLKVRTHRDQSFTPVNRADGDTCDDVFPGTHWCTLQEIQNRELQFSDHTGYMLGTRQMVYTDAPRGCNGGVACSNNFNNQNTAGCGLTPNCENSWCTGEALICCE